MEIEADESFKKAGAIPFKWEIRPGVPKLQHSQQQPQQQVSEKNESRPIQLKPPPIAGARSDRHVLTRPVASDGCFPRATEKKKKKKQTGPDYLSDLETVSRWSVSSRKSISPFHDSLSSSFSSRESSPRRPVSDADWVGWALF